MFGFLKKRVPVISQEFKCPYCFVVLDKEPTRKQKCKSCKQEFSIRTHYLSRAKLILTQKDTVKYDLEKERYYLDKSLIDNLKLCMQDDKKMEALVDKTTKDLAVKFGQSPSLGDVAWGIANRLILEAMKKGDMQFLRFIYSQMAYYLFATGRNYVDVAEKSFEIDLREYKKSKVVTAVEILATEDSCEACKAQAGVVPLDEAIKNKLLPCKTCSHNINDSGKGWCRCCYAPSVS